MRYVATAREALVESGIDDPARHLLVATSEDPFTSGLSTIIVSKAPLTQDRIDRFVQQVESTSDSTVVYAPGTVQTDSPVAALAAAPDQATADSLIADYPASVHAISDDAPFFWHFSGFNDVVKDIGRATTVDFREYAIGERVLLLLLVIATLFAVLFLLLPFLVIRRQWKRLPAKGTSALYFAALGLGFMLFEITMIQMLVGYLGYPSYSLTVTLASILVFTGCGALLSNRFSTAAHEGPTGAVHGAGSVDRLLPARPSPAHGIHSHGIAAVAYCHGVPGARTPRAVSRHVHAVRAPYRRGAQSLFG